MKHIPELPLRNAIGQMLMVGFYGAEPTPEIIDMIERYRVGGVIFFSRNIQTKEQVAALTANLQSIARKAHHEQPLLIAVDQENGMVRRFNDLTLFPGNMAQGAIHDREVTYHIAYATALEMLSVGVNMNLAPVADVNNNPLNPVIGVRSFGEDSGLVSELATAAMQGLQAAGMTANVKHFPGHGDTATDSHRALPIIMHSREHLNQVELPPFIAAISQGADSIMVGHMALPAIVGDTTPACLAPVIVTELLRRELAYNGVIMTDCLEMDAVKETTGVPAGAIQAINAGNDLILISHTYSLQSAAIEEIYRAYETGEITPQAVEQALARIHALKARRLRWDSVPAQYDPQQHQALAHAAYARSVTIAHNPRQLIPLRVSAEERLLVIIPLRKTVTMVEDKNYPAHYLAEQILACKPNAAIYFQQDDVSADDASLRQTIESADTIVMCTVNALSDPQQAAVMQECIASGKPVIDLALYSPYDKLAFAEPGAYMTTYEFTRPAVDAALAILFGE